LYLRPGELLAASGNRNERLARASLPPRVEGDVLAPRDQHAHGTWLGLNRRGLFACITNRHGGMFDSARRSRGLLVAEALGASSAAELRDRLASISPQTYNGFHLVHADLAAAFVTWNDGDKVHQRELEPEQLHVVTERSFGAGEGERERSVREAFAGRPLEVRSWRVPMTAHATEPMESACVHADAVGYGTRSSLQLLLREHSAQLLWTEGHPCTEPASELSGEATLLLAGDTSR
jgi:hypothetical protein